MTTLDQTKASVAVAPLVASEGFPHSYMDWPAILGGAAVAAAISTLLTTFGAAVGLSAVSAYANKGLSATALGIAAGLWVLWVGVTSVAAGGYLAGRMRGRSHDATEHESDIRDGAHGLVVWALGTLLVAYLATTSVAGIARSATGVAAGAASATANATLRTLGDATDPVAHLTDRLWRPTSVNASPIPAPANEIARQEASHILASVAMSGSIGDEDKTWLAQQISVSTGVTKDEATKRVDDAMTQLNDAASKARNAAETARKTGVLVAFLTAASLLVSAAAAWWAATLGGNHRDQGINFSDLKTWR